MLHIHNGESSAGTLKQSSVPGEIFSFQDALIGGPTPAGLRGEDWRRVRSHHLSESYGVDLAECERSLLNQDQTLASFSDHDEVVLWFEHDLFCQANLLYLLDWFAARELGKTKLSLICIGEFRGVEKFRGLGELNADQLASLFDTRHEVTAAVTKLATAAWQAYCSPDPTAIERLMSNDTSALSFLRAALRGHLARFPSVRNGLGRIENSGLELIRDGHKEFINLFSRFTEAEPVYGLGDSQFYLSLKQLSDARERLLVAKNGSDSGGGLDCDRERKLAFEITERGEAVRKGERDFVEMNGIDLWLGGVHLISEKNIWRWDDETETMVSC